LQFSSGAEPGVVRQIASVLLVFVLLGAVLRKLGKSQGSLYSGANALVGLWRRSPSANSFRKTPLLHAVERVVLTPQHTLHLVHVEGRQIVVATYPNGCDLLLDAEQPAPAKGEGE
jgi:flagellar biogenesis protein FliO